MDGYGSSIVAVGAATTANIGDANGGVLWAASVFATGATSTLVLREGGSSGTVILSLSVVANTSHSLDLHGAVYKGQLHATTTGAAGGASVVYGK